MVKLRYSAIEESVSILETILSVEIGMTIYNAFKTAKKLMDFHYLGQPPEPGLPNLSTLSPDQVKELSPLLIRFMISEQSLGIFKILEWARDDMLNRAAAQDLQQVIKALNGISTEI